MTIEFYMDEDNLANAINNADGLNITTLIRKLEPSLLDLIEKEIKKIKNES